MESSDIATGQMEQLRVAAEGAFGAMVDDEAAAAAPPAAVDVDGSDVRRVR